MILHHDPADLFDLIRLSLTSPGLQVQNLRYTVLCKDVVVAADPLREAQAPKQVPQVIEPDIRIRIAAQDPQGEIFVLGDAAFLHQRSHVA
jgi:hypothetical protein